MIDKKEYKKLKKEAKSLARGYYPVTDVNPWGGSVWASKLEKQAEHFKACLEFLHTVRILLTVNAIDEQQAEQLTNRLMGAEAKAVGRAQ